MVTSLTCVVGCVAGWGGVGGERGAGASLEEGNVISRCIMEQLKDANMFDATQWYILLSNTTWLGTVLLPWKNSRTKPSAYTAA